MKLIHRIGYYLGGFAIGLIILAFFLGGKRASCAYGPNARTVKNIGSKKKAFSPLAISEMDKLGIDSLALIDLIRTGDVNFSKSDTKKDSCKLYFIDNSHESQDVELQIKNCDSLATIISIHRK